jgi:hypothetical protein
MDSLLGNQVRRVASLQVCIPAPLISYLSDFDSAQEPVRVLRRNFVAAVHISRFLGIWGPNPATDGVSAWPL